MNTREESLDYTGLDSNFFDYSYRTTMQQLVEQWTKYRYGHHTKSMRDGIMSQITKPKIEYKEEL